MSVVVPEPLRAIHKLLFHSSALNNLEKPPVFFLLPLSELVTQVQLQTKPPPYQAHPGALAQPTGDEHPCRATGVAAIGWSSQHGAQCNSLDQNFHFSSWK